MTSPKPSSPIEVAARNHRFWFFMYLGWILVAAVASAIFTAMLWRAGNRQQDAVVAETNERAQKLEGDLLGAKIDFAKAKTAQVEAEKSLLELKELIRQPRTIDEQRANGILDWGQKGSVEIGCIATLDEPNKLGIALANILLEHAWNVSGPNAIVSVGGVSPGITVVLFGETQSSLTNPDDVPEPARTLCKMLATAVKGNTSLLIHLGPGISKDKISVTIGTKY